MATRWFLFESRCHSRSADVVLKSPGFNEQTHWQCSARGSTSDFFLFVRRSSPPKHSKLHCDRIRQSHRREDAGRILRNAHKGPPGMMRPLFGMCAAPRPHSLSTASLTGTRPGLSQPFVGAVMVTLTPLLTSSPMGRPPPAFRAKSAATGPLAPAPAPLSTPTA